MRHPRSADVREATAFLIFIAITFVFLCCTTLTTVSLQLYNRSGWEFTFFNSGSGRPKNLFTISLVNDLTRAAEIPCGSLTDRISAWRVRKPLSHFLPATSFFALKLFGVLLATARQLENVLIHPSWFEKAFFHSQTVLSKIGFEVWWKDWFSSQFSCRTISFSGW
jgi:hypothetical protein